MRKMSAIALALALLMMAGAATAESAEGIGAWFEGAVTSAADYVKTGGELEVRATAVRTVAPDTASMRIGVSMERSTEKDAQAEANAVINAVIEGLRGMGLQDDQIATTGYNVTRKSTGSARFSLPASYVAYISLTVTTRDFEQINAILDMAVAAGANSVGSVSFSLSDEGSVYRQALKDAIAAARAKAEDMAEAAGVSLYTLLALRETSGYGAAYYNAYAPMASMDEEAYDAGTQIMAGDLEISASVTLVYQIK